MRHCIVHEKYFQMAHSSWVCSSRYKIHRNCAKITFKKKSVFSQLTLWKWNHRVFTKKKKPQSYNDYYKSLRWNLILSHSTIYKLKDDNESCYLIFYYRRSQVQSLLVIDNHCKIIQMLAVEFKWEDQRSKSESIKVH